MAQSGLWLVYVPNNWGTVVLFPVMGRYLFLFHRIQTSIKTHPPSYPVDTQGHSPGIKQPMREADNSPLSSAKIMKVWGYISVCHYVFMTWGFFKNRDNFTALIFLLQRSAMKSFFEDIKFLHIHQIISYYSSFLKNAICYTEVKKYLAHQNKRSVCISWSAVLAQFSLFAKDWGLQVRWLRLASPNSAAMHATDTSNLLAHLHVIMTLCHTGTEKMCWKTDLPYVAQTGIFRNFEILVTMWNVLEIQKLSLICPFISQKKR